MKLKDKIEIIRRKLIVDSRGYFLKVIDGKERGLPKHTGEIYITIAKPNESRGGHYHSIAYEWFTLIKGEATLVLEDVNTQERISIQLSEKDPKTIMVPPEVAHIFYNSSSLEFILLAYCDSLFDPIDTIAFKFNN